MCKFEPSCGPLTQCGMKQMCALTNVCNAGLDANDQLDTVVKVHAIQAIVFTNSTLAFCFPC